MPQSLWASHDEKQELHKSQGGSDKILSAGSQGTLIEQS